MLHTKTLNTNVFVFLKRPIKTVSNSKHSNFAKTVHHRMKKGTEPSGHKFVSTFDLQLENIVKRLQWHVTKCIHIHVMFPLGYS